ncbi:hypothetical protein BC834DRAFT_822438 [Gloeopeniophorella convolvens]|nr:hypothetical protein BC834DRAFT_822438 [Gloeopeniophorella convolvens]
MFSNFLVLLLAAAAPSAYANVFATSPTAATVWNAGQAVTIAWQDDGNAPNLAAFGPCSIGLFAGSVQQQTLLQEIADNVDVSQVSSVPFTPQASVGPSGAYYFIRFTSNSLKDATQPQFPQQSFTAKFMLNGMTGIFNQTVQAEVDGSSVPVGAPPATSNTPPASTPPASTSSSNSASSASKASSTPSGSAAANAKNGAGRVAASGVLGFAGVAAIALSLFV